MEQFVVILFGLIIGSFLNVCICRIPKGESVAFPPSHCTNCGERIKWYDLIPVISYVILRGKCRNCGEKISIRYPAVELFTGLVYLALYIKYGYTINLLKYAVLSGFLIVIGFIDYDTTDVYLKTTLPGIVSGILFMIISYINGQGIMSFIYGGVLGYGIIALLILLTKGMGWGDAEICLLCGVFLGIKLSVLMLLLSFVIGGIAGVILLVRKKVTIKNMIAFGPFIAIAGIITSIFGDRLMTWYLHRLI